MHSFEFNKYRCTITFEFWHWQNLIGNKQWNLYFIKKQKLTNQ